MPQTTPKQKIDQVKMFGREHIEVVLIGDTFDDSSQVRMNVQKRKAEYLSTLLMMKKLIAGQGTVAVEILNDVEEPIDFVFASIGGGGLMSGISTYIKSVSTHTKLVGVEPSGAASMKASIENGSVYPLSNMINLLMVLRVKCVGQKTYEICSQFVDDIIPVPEGKVCTTILEYIMNML